MVKLVVLSEGLTGQSYELKVDKTTVGRVDDNTFQVPHPSVSSHHCEVLLKGSDVIVKDLNSTNGTFINNQQITDEAPLKPGQTLRLGQIEIRLESGSGSAPPGSKRGPADSTMVISKGVSLEQLGGGEQGFDTTKGVFTKKSNKTNKWFILIGIVLLLVIVVAFYMVFTSLNAQHPASH